MFIVSPMLGADFIWPIFYLILFRLVGSLYKCQLHKLLHIFIPLNIVYIWALQ